MENIKKTIKEVKEWLDKPCTFINGLVAIGLIAVGIIMGYIWFAPY